LPKIEKMKAIICTQYGPPDVLKMAEMEAPVPRDNEVLIKVFFTTVTVADCRVRGFNVPPSFWLPAKLALGWTKPRQPVLGTELSGVVQKTGKNVRKFKPGDAVFAYPGAKGGGYAEYICMDENAAIALKPEHLSLEQAAALSFGGNTALYFLQKSALTKGEKILIYGASGCVGSAALQLAKYFGAETTAVCSTGNMDLVKSLGADQVIDYTQTDLSEIQEKFDVVFDAVGKADIAKAIGLVKPRGRFLHSVATPLTGLKIRLRLLGSDIQFIGGDAQPDVGRTDFIRELANEGIFKPVIDRQYHFDEMVQAHEYVDKGHKKGNVTIKVV
jgi:NADPH:quinone reductase-like Zn-dependent oxidoreductase